MSKLNRRKFLWVVGGLSAWAGCSKTPPPPAFIADLQLLSRDGTPLAEKWTIPIENPIDPTLQYQIVADHLREYGGRQVVAPDQWDFVVNVEHEGEQLPIGGPFHAKKWFGEECVGDCRGELIWESPDCPPTIKPEVQWKWGHCRVHKPAEYTFVVYLLPTIVRIGGGDMMIDHGPGIEIFRKEFVVEPGKPPQAGLSMCVKNGDVIPRSIHRKMRQRKKG